MSNDQLTACELFNSSAEAFRQGDLPESVASLRGAFFENLYVAPLLLGEDHYPQSIWYASPDGEPTAANEYIERYGRFWRDDPRALDFLSAVWSDPLVRAELTKFLNLSKNMLGATTQADFSELLREREMFLNPERLKRTQSEILERIREGNLRVPLPKPRLALTLLASGDPAASVEFYRQLLDVEPVTTSPTSGGYAEFDFSGVRLAIHGQDRLASGDPYKLGPRPDSLGWGAIFVIRVTQVAFYHENAQRAGVPIVDSDLSTKGRRFFVVKDPSGYVLEITEEDPGGLELI